MQNLYSHTPYIFTKHLHNLMVILTKAKDFAASKGMSDADLLGLRLAPDMFPLVRQIQSVSDSSKGLIARLSATTAPKMEDNESTIDECIERLKKTILYIESVDPESFSKADDYQATLSYIPGKYQNMMDFTLDMVLPNFFFHFTTAYNILRAEGMEIGKTDYIGNLKLHDLT